MSRAVRIVGLSVASLAIAGTLSSCSHSPSTAHKNAARKTTSTTSSTTTTTTSTTSTTSTTAVPPLPSTTAVPGATVPNVIGAKIAAARAALHAATLVPVSLNTPCSQNTLASQSVVSSLSIPGKAPAPSVGAVPLRPGTVVAPGTRVGITWSGCFGDSSEVPAVVGLSFGAARLTLRAVGLAWACYSVGQPTTTTEASTGGDTTTTVKVKVPPTVLTQNPAAHTTVHPGTIVSMTMYRCPQ